MFDADGETWQLNKRECRSVQSRAVCSEKRCANILFGRKITAEFNLTFKMARMGERRT